MIEIRQAETEAEIQQVKELLIEYSDWVRREVDKVEDLSTVVTFRNHAAEIAGLPGLYSPPDGRLLLATDDGQPAGCVGLKNLGDGKCEIKRMYVRPAFRGQGIARKLVERLIQDATAIGYQAVYLDTHIDLKPAHALYYSYGFQPIEAYFSADEAFIAASIFMKRELP